MDVLLTLFFASLPYLLALLAAAIVIAIGGAALRRPWLLLLPFLLALYWLTESRFGRIDGGGGPTLLTRGAGVLLFPAFLWALLLVWVWLRLGESFREPTPRYSAALTPWFSAWVLLLVGHVAVALVIGVPLKESLAPAGFGYMAWLGVVLAVMLAVFRRPDDAKLLALFIVVMGSLRAAFGLVRYAFMGGDPANAYANRQGLSLKLTFFDTNDSLICALTLAVALVLLYRSAPPQGWRLWQRFGLWAAVAMAAACIVLSFRRTAWLGVLLALAFVLMQLPRRARWRLMFVVVPATLAAIAYAAWKRLSQVSGPSSGFLFDLMPRNFGTESPRLLELKLAWQTLMEAPFLGVGSWGSYKGWQQISWQVGTADGGAGTFLHSGVLHIALKTGLVGLVLFVGTCVVFWLSWRRLRHALPAQALPLAIAGVAGVLFTVPDWLLGTPVPQIRTMVMLGFCLGLPFVAERCYGARPVRGQAAARGDIPVVRPARRPVGLPSGQWQQ